MKHILFLILPLLPALALAQTGTVKDSVRVLTTAEIAEGNSVDSAHFYFIQDGSWKKIRMDSIARFARVKLLGDRGDIDVSADGLTWTVDTGAVTSAKLAASAVDLTATTVTGTLPVSKGGTGLGALGGANRIPYANSSNTALTTGDGLTYNGTNFATGGTATATKFIPTGGTATGTGLYMSVESTTMGLSIGSLNLFNYTNGGNFGIGPNNTDPQSILSDFSTSARGIAIQNGYPILAFSETGTTPTNKFFFGLDAGEAYFWNKSSNGQIRFATNNVERMRITSAGQIGIGIAPTDPTARLHLAAGGSGTSGAPLKFTSGTELTTPEVGAMEFHNSNLYFTPSGTNRRFVNIGLTGSATLDFPSTDTQESADLTIGVTGAADGDVVSLGVPNVAVNANTSYSAWVSGANTVTVRFNNYSSGTVNPTGGTFKVFVTKF